MLNNPPTARFNRDTGEFEYLSGGSPRPPSPYSAGQVDVKGHHYDIVIPHGLHDRAEAAGLKIGVTIKAAALRGLREATKPAEGVTISDRTGNTEAAARSRASLGAEIQAAREEAHMSRKDLIYGCWRALDRMGEQRARGWSATQVQQWELGRFVPRLIEPVIEALGIEADEPEAAQRWRNLWASAKRGIDGPEPVEVITVEFPDNDELERQVREMEAEVEELERGAADRL